MEQEQHRDKTTATIKRGQCSIKAGDQATSHFTSERDNSATRRSSSACENSGPPHVLYWKRSGHNQPMPIIPVLESARLHAQVAEPKVMHNRHRQRAVSGGMRNQLAKRDDAKIAHTDAHTHTPTRPYQHTPPPGPTPPLPSPATPVRTTASCQCVTTPCDNN